MREQTLHRIYFTSKAVSYEEIFPRNFGAGGVKNFPWKISSGAQSEHLGPSLRPCVNVLIESVQKICRQNLSKIKLCDWPNKLDTTS